MSDETTTTTAPEASPEPTGTPVPPAAAGANGAAHPLKVTSVAEWRRRRNQWWWVTLPSGAVVRARRPDWYQLIKDGTVDADDLMGIDTGERKLGAMVARIYPVARRCLSHILIEPAIGTDDFTEEDVSVTDTVSLFSWANGQSSAVVAQPGE